MDTFFVSHGSPMLAIDDSIPARAFFQSWRSEVLQVIPKAILVVSGHYDTDVPTVDVVKGANPTIYDFYGFPPSMYQIKYPAPGAPDLARRVKELLEKGGFGPVKEEESRGLDHGAWVPLMLMYPEANVPVCELSVQSEKDGEHHYNMGKALAPLREEGILIIGTGNATHNLRDGIALDNGPPPEWALKFDTWLKESLLDGKYDDVNHYDVKAPYGRKAHPWPDHFYPLHVAMGAAGEKAKAHMIHHSWTNRTISYASYRFTKPSE